MTERQHPWTTRAVPVELERRYVDEGWWTDATLGDQVAGWLGARPATTVSVHSRTRPWQGTFADIEREARRLAALLGDAGIEPGEVVAFQIPNWREAVVAFAALSMGGYVLVPIVHIYGRREVSFILRQSGAVAYLSPLAHGHVDYADIVVADPPPQLRVHVVIDGDEGSSVGPLHRIPWSQVDRHQPIAAPASVAPTDIAVIAYTSGTTSEPKGVLHDHRTLLSELEHMAGWITPGRPNLMGSPVTHATGMIGAVLGPLRSGSEIHLIDRWDPGHALEVMRAHGIGGGTGASVFLSGLLDHPDFTPEHAANMPQVGLGGAPVPVALGERAEALGVKIIRAYGSTEHPSTTGSQFADPPAMRHRTDGRPMPGVELRLLDEDGNEVPAGVAGEIFSRGPELCLGYTDAALNEAFDDDGWYRTGDIGVVDADGCLTITDRAKDVIIRGGENLSPAEIEAALQDLPGVAEVAVVAAPDARLGEHACAVFRMLPGAELIGLEPMRAHLERQGLARQKWPEEIRVVDDFTRTASGKVRKVDLREWLRSTNEER